MHTIKFIAFSTLITCRAQFIAETDIGFMNFETEESRNTDLPKLDQVIINMTDQFLPLVRAQRPSNERWANLLNRYSQRRLKGGRCFNADISDDLVQSTSMAGSLAEYFAVFHQIIDATMANCNSYSSWGSRLTNAAAKFQWWCRWSFYYMTN